MSSKNGYPMPNSESGLLPQSFQLETIDGKQSPFDVQSSITSTIGLTREELEKYRMDPLWRMLRILFITASIVIWLALCIVAVFLIIMSPKCKNYWFQDKLNYQIFVPAFRDSDGDGIGDFKGIEEKLQILKDIGAEVLWLSPVLAVQKDDFEPFDVIDHLKTDERLGSEDDLKRLIERIHELRMYVVADLPIATSSIDHKWFQNAISGDKGNETYFVWKSANNVVAGDGYVLRKSGNAYLSFNNRDPILKWDRNTHMHHEMRRAAFKLLDYGFDGLYFPDMKYALRPDSSDDKLRNDAYNLLRNFNAELKKRPNRDEDVALIITADSLDGLSGNKTSELMSDYSFLIFNNGTKMSWDKCDDKIGLCVHQILSNALSFFTEHGLIPSWRFNSVNDSRFSTRYGVAESNLLTFLQLMLPGNAQIYYGQELGLDGVKRAHSQRGSMQWNGDANAGFSTSNQTFFVHNDDYITMNYENQGSSNQSMLKTFKTITDLRHQYLKNALMNLAEIDGEVIKFSRVVGNGESDNSVFIIVCNFDTYPQDVNITSLIPSARKGQPIKIVAVTPNSSYYNVGDILTATYVNLGANVGTVMNI